MSRVTRAVFFDVDFTLIQPGRMFQGAGYCEFCKRHGMAVEESAFDAAVESAASLLDSPEEATYDAELFIAYTRHIIERMGGSGPAVHTCAREIYAEWAACRHFELYDDVPAVLQELSAAGIRIGLISNSHRCLTSFQSHFELDGLVTAALSSAEYGFMKPHPSIFVEALRLVDVPAANAVMVGDSVRQDVDGALGVGMRAVLLHRRPDSNLLTAAMQARGVPVITSLHELPEVL
jgi:putative hydrolase of the HAD superfamily